MQIVRILVWVALICNVAYGQVAVERNLGLELAERDSTKSASLEKALNAFLTEAQSGEFSNEYVDADHLKKYEFFFDKLSGIGRDNEDFNSPMVLKSYTPDGETYALTVGFTGEKDGAPFIYQITELRAVPYQDHYRFYCRFAENTAHFKSRAIKNVTYYYSDAIDEEKAYEFAQFKDELSDLTETPRSHLDYYCFQSLDELLKSYGFLYSARQCNFLCYDLGFTENEGQTYVTGTNNENYVFGFVGNYLYYNLPDRDNMYLPFVQGISTYYGGYGLSYESVDVLKQQFRDELAENPDVDFLAEFKKGRKSSVNRHFSYYVMSAFLCEEVVNEKGFKDVLTLAYSGGKGERFFENLTRILGVNESNFHETILRLISE